jgi:hypothetical protein
MGTENEPASREANAKEKRYTTGIALAYTLFACDQYEQVNGTKEL